MPMNLTAHRFLRTLLPSLVHGRRTRFANGIRDVDGDAAGERRSPLRPVALPSHGVPAAAVLAVLTIVAAQGSVSGISARGQETPLSIRLAYVHQGNIWILDEPSGRRTRLTADEHESSPRWTTDGQALLFQRHIRGRLQTLRWQPGQAIQHLRNGLWSPDGTAVAFTRAVDHAASATTVWISRQGKTARITPINRRFQWSPLAWSPDSGRLALARFTIPPPTKPGQAIPPSSASLWLAVGASGTATLRRLPMPPLSPGHPGWPDLAFWSPDGRYLTVVVGPDMPCVSCRADGRPYYAIPLDGGTVIPLGVALAPEQAISWGSDSSYVVVSGDGGRETYYHKHLVRVDPITRKHRTLSRNSRRADVEPAVSPDAKCIAFARGRSPQPSSRVGPPDLIASRHVFLMRSTGTDPRRLTNAPGWTDEAPAWSSDGRWLLFIRWRRHQQGHVAAVSLWAVRTDGSSARRLARLDLPPFFNNGFGYYGAFSWQSLFDITPASP